MRRNLLFSLACSALLFPLAANATAIDNVNSDYSVATSSQPTLIAGFPNLGGIKETVEGVRDDINNTNETVTDTIDAGHGVNDGIGDGKKIVEGGGQTNDSEVIEQTQVSEGTEGIVSPTDDSASF